MGVRVSSRSRGGSRQWQVDARKLDKATGS
jgi:hypothetical protein